MTTSARLDSELHFPDSDGQPLADNTEQYRWIVLIKENLDVLFANPRRTHPLHTRWAEIFEHGGDE